MSCICLLLLFFLLILYLWRKCYTTKEEDRGLATSLAGIEYRCKAPADIAMGVMGSDGKGSCTVGEQTHQHVSNPAHGPGPSLRPHTFVNWCQDQKVLGESPDEGGQDSGALQVQPYNLVLPRAPKWCSATNQYQSIMPDFIEALELLAGPPARAEYSDRGKKYSVVERGKRKGMRGWAGREGGAIDVKGIEDSGAERIPQLGGGEKMKSTGGRTKVGGWGMFKKEGSTPGSISGGEGQEWETASETSSKSG